jgi:DNA-binding transcriptional ArsR family regulator
MIAIIFATIYLRMITRRDVFQAIADPTRRAIILLIAFQAMTPNAIAEHFDTTRQAVSKHLRILTECQLVKQEQSGREIYYRLNGDRMQEIDQWLEQFRQIWENRFNELDKVLLTMKTNSDEQKPII